MSILDSIRTGPTLSPVRLLLHGQEGVGKTSWAAGCPDSLFLTAEDGGGDLDYARAEVTTWKGLRRAVEDLIANPGPFRTVVIDTIDTFERLLWAFLCERARVESIEEVGGGFGKGYTQATEEMSELAKALDELRTKTRMNVILLAHSHVKTFNDPLGNPYDRYEVQLHKGASALWKGWADGVYFAAFEVTVRTAKRNAAIDVKGKAESGRRVLYTTKDPAYDAKQRHNLPEELPLSWQAFSKAMRWDERDAAQRGPATKHHPSFTPEERARFFAKLGELGLPYEEAVAPWHEHFHKCRPSALPQAKRNDLLAYLGTPGGRAEVTGFVAQAAK